MQLSKADVDKCNCTRKSFIINYIQYDWLSDNPPYQPIFRSLLKSSNDHIAFTAMHSKINLVHHLLHHSSSSSSLWSLHVLE